MSRIDEIRALDDGWYGPGSLAPAEEQVSDLVAAHQFIPREAHISAAADGSVAVEWEAGEQEYCVSLERNHTLVFVHETSDGELVDQAVADFSAHALRRMLSGHAS